MIVTVAVVLITKAVFVATLTTVAVAVDVSDVIWDIDLTITGVAVDCRTPANFATDLMVEMVDVVAIDDILLTTLLSKVVEVVAILIGALITPLMMLDDPVAAKVMADFATDLTIENVEVVAKEAV